MPDSTSLTRDNSKEAIMKRLGDAYGRVKTEHKENPEDIPRWARTALIYKAVDGMSYKEAVKRVGREEKSAKTLANYARSPAGKKWVGYLAEFIDDPIEMAKAKEAGKTIILYSPEPIPTPWPIHFSDHVVSSHEEMIEILSNLKKNSK